MLRLIILDRDGVINQDSVAFIKKASEWAPLPQSLEAIAALSQAGFLVHVATNQSGIGRGLFSLDDLEAIHQKMHQSLAALGGKVDFIAFCPHRPEEACVCRKPKPGLIHQCLQKASVLPQDAFVIGDSLRDLEAAKAASCLSALVLTGNGIKTQQENPDWCNATPVFENLWAATQYLRHLA